MKVNSLVTLSACSMAVLKDAQLVMNLVECWACLKVGMMEHW